jgi:hypothetical protein
MKIETVPVEMPTYSAADVWAASAAAYRLNGNQYLKVTTKKLSPNKHFMGKLLKDPKKILPEDYAFGEKARAYFQGEMLLRVLKGNILRDYLVEAAVAAQAETITKSDKNWNMIASLTNVYVNESKVQDWIERSVEIIEGSIPYGTPGSPVNLELKVLNSRFHKGYCNYAINAINDAGQLFFWFQYEPAVEDDMIKVSGIIKTHYQGKTTQLYGVRMEKEKK